MTQVTRIETDARGVATLWLDRPEAHNAMNAQMIAELHAAAETLGQDSAVRVVLLRGAGRSFCAGGDLNWMRAQMTADRATRMTEAGALAAMLGALNRMPKPLIAVVEGNAFGGGIGLMSVCDHAIAVERATFALTETRLGLIPATIGPYVISRLGPKARSVFWSGRVFDGAEAVRLGLLDRVVGPEAMAEAIEAELAPYLATAPGAVAAAKGLALELGLGVADEQVARSITALADQWETDEARQGVAAFFAKKAPPWAS